MQTQLNVRAKVCGDKELKETRPIGDHHACILDLFGNRIEGCDAEESSASHPSAEFPNKSTTEFYDTWCSVRSVRPLAYVENLSAMEWEVTLPCHVSCPLWSV